MENKKIPFFDFVVSEENFDTTESYSNFNLVIEKKENCFEMHFTNHVPANVHYYVLNGKYAYCIDEEKLADYLINKGIELTINDNWKTFNETVKKKDENIKHNKYNEIQRIALYDKLTVYIDHFEVVEINDLFSVNIEDAGDIIKNWIQKYKKLVNEHRDHLCVELSAGLDTRSLTYFWRDGDIYQIYTKNDPDEIEIVQELHDKHFPWTKLSIGKKDSSICDGDGNVIKEIISLSGKGGDLFDVKSRFADPEFYKNNTCFFKTKHLIKYICPYLDREFARINPRTCVPKLKVIMQYILAKDLMDVEYKSFKREKFVFTKEMEFWVNKIIEKIM